MSKDISTSILDQGQFEFYEVTEHGITFAANTPREEWLKAVEQLTQMHESSGRLHFRAICILADALNYGEQEYGEEYAQAIDETRAWMRVSSKTIHNAMWVMKQIPSTRRRELLSLSHHEAVAALEGKEQDELLALAEKDSMTVAELRKLVAERHPKTKKGKDRKSKSTSKATISNMTEAKAAAVELSNYLTVNEEKVTDAMKVPLEHLYKIYRRHWQSGRKK